MAAKHPASCQDCPLDEKGSGFTQIEGTGSAQIMCIADISGEHESRDSLPLRPYAPAGSVFEMAIRAAGLDRQQLSLTNCIRCRPPRDWLEGAPWEYAALNHCRSNLDIALQERKPKVIIALGAVATRSLTGLAGEKQGVSYLRGYVFPAMNEIPAPCECVQSGGIVDKECFLCAGEGTSGTRHEQGQGWVIPTFHPSFLRRSSMNLFHVLVNDIKKAKLIAQRGFQPQPVQYQIKPSVDEAWAFYQRAKDNPQLWLAVDIETPYSRLEAEDERDDDPSWEIESVQFSLTSHEGIFFPHKDGYREIIKALLALPNPKVNHNLYTFDAPRLRHNGYSLAGDLHDTLWMWKHFQPDLVGKKGQIGHLQGVASFFGFDWAWKHLADTEPERYGCADVDAVQRIVAKLPEQMKAKGVWDSYERHIQQFHPILVRMQDRGVPIDNDARLNMKVVLEKEQDIIFAELQTKAPEEVRKVDPKQGYKGQPPMLKKALGAGTDPLSLRMIDPQEHSYCYRQRLFEIVDDETMATELVTRWCRVYDFNPNSGDDIIRYMKHRKHKVPTDFKTGDETTAKKELERLARSSKDDIYLKIIEWREMGKMVGTYVDGYVPAADGRVHTTYTFAPATGQLSSRNPNVQNAPRRGNLADAFRRMQHARGGRKIVEVDMSGFHALTTGFEAKDANYMRMARLDMHSFIAGHFLKSWNAEKLFGETDEELRDKFKWFKSDPSRKAIRDNKAKPTAHGVQFGLGYRKCYQMNLESFESEGEAKRFREMVEFLFPKVFEWQEKVKDLAHEQRYLLSRFGYIRWFWDVKQWDGRTRKLKAGGDAEAAIAFLPANDAHAMMREIMTRIDQKGYAERFCLYNMNHDSTVYEPLAEEAEECARLIVAESEKPEKMLVDPVVAPEGLWCGAEAKIGDNWADCKEFKISSTINAAQA